MSKYVLISFYERETFNWVVYGHVHAGHNEKLGEYVTMLGAIDKALQYHAPIYRGISCTRIVEKLTGRGEGE